MTDRIVYKNNFINLDIKRALSVYSNRSASGKTYLPYYVQYFKDFPRIFVMPNELSYKEFIKTPWRAGDEAIYFFDRFDLFGTMELLNILAEKPYICTLLDYKGLSLLSRNKIAYENVIIERKGVSKFEVSNGILF